MIRSLPAVWNHPKGMNGIMAKPCMTSSRSDVWHQAAGASKACIIKNAPSGDGEGVSAPRKPRSGEWVGGWGGEKEKEKEKAEAP